jgi:hypothetical protein
MKTSTSVVVVVKHVIVVSFKLLLIMMMMMVVEFIEEIGVHSDEDSVNGSMFIHSFIVKKAEE